MFDADYTFELEDDYGTCRGRYVCEAKRQDLEKVYGLTPGAAVNTYLDKDRVFFQIQVPEVIAFAEKRERGGLARDAVGAAKRGVQLHAGEYLEVEAARGLTFEPKVPFGPLALDEEGGKLAAEIAAGTSSVFDHAWNEFKNDDPGEERRERQRMNGVARVFVDPLEWKKGFAVVPGAAGGPGAGGPGAGAGATSGSESADCNTKGGVGAGRRGPPPPPMARSKSLGINQFPEVTSLDGSEEQGSAALSGSSLRMAPGYRFGFGKSKDSLPEEATTSFVRLTSADSGVPARKNRHCAKSQSQREEDGLAATMARLSLVCRGNLPRCYRAFSRICNPFRKVVGCIFFIRGV